MMFSPSPLSRNAPKSASLKSVTVALRVVRMLQNEVYSTGRCGYASCQMFESFGSSRTSAWAREIVMDSPYAGNEPDDVLYMVAGFWRNMTSTRLSALFAVPSHAISTTRDHTEVASFEKVEVRPLADTMEPASPQERFEATSPTRVSTKAVHP